MPVDNPNIICIKNNAECKHDWKKFRLQRPKLFGRGFNLEESIATQVSQVWADAFSVVDVQSATSKYLGVAWDFVLAYIKDGSDRVNGVCALEFRMPKHIPYVFIDALAVNEDSRGQKIGKSLCAAAEDVAKLIWKTSPQSFEKMYLALNVEKSDGEKLTPIYEKLGFHVASRNEIYETAFDPREFDDEREFRMVKRLVL